MRSDFTEDTPDASQTPMGPVVSEVTTRWVDVEATAVEIQVRGEGFTASSILFWKEQALATTVLGDTELSAVLPLGDTVSWTEAQVYVRGGGSSGRTSNRSVLPYPVPELLSASLSPESPGFGSRGRLTLTGRNLVRGSHVEYQGSLYPVTVLSTERADVELPMSAVFEGVTGTLHLQLQTSRPEQRLSNMLTVRVFPPDVEIQGALPSSLSTTGVENVLTLFVKNSWFVSRVKWNGQPVRFVYFAEMPALSLTLPAEARSKPGLVTLTVEGSGSDGGEPAPFLLPIVDAPVVQRLSASTFEVGTPFNWLTLQGEGWGPAVDVYWDDKVLELQPSSHADVAVAVVPEAELSRPGLHGVRVRRKSDGAMSRSVPVEVVEVAPAPVVFGLEPSVLSVGDSPVRLQVHGAGIRPNSVLRIDGKERVSQPNGTISITTLLESQDLAEAGVHTVTVSTPGPGGGTSLPLLLKVEAHRPAPHLASLPAPFVTAGGGPLTLSVTGTGLGAYSVVRWNGTFLTTRWEPLCCGRFQLVADVPAERLGEPGVARVTVFNPSPGGGASNAIDFPILPLGASAPELDPRTVELGSADVVVKVRGSGFSPSTFVMVGETSRATTFIDSTTVTVTLEAWELAMERTLRLQTVTPRPEGSAASAPQSLHVIPPWTPIMRSVVPGVVAAGQWERGAVRSIDVRGENFDRTKVEERGASLRASLDWGGTSYPMQVNSSSWNWETGPMAYVPGLAVEKPGRVEVRVSRAGDAGGSSLPALINVVAERSVPQVYAVRPGNLQAGAASHVLLIEGYGFHPASVVRWNGQVLETWRAGETSLRAAVPRELVATPATARVTVETPAPGGGVSTPMPVVVEGP